MIPEPALARLRTLGDRPDPLIPLTEIVLDPSPQLVVSADQAPDPVGPNRDIWQVGPVEVGPCAEGHWVTAPRRSAVFIGSDEDALQIAAALVASVQLRRSDLARDI